MIEKCLNVQLDDEDLIQACHQAGIDAEKYWRSLEGDEMFQYQISHVIDHPFPAIPPRFIEGETLEQIRLTAETKLGKPVVQIDGIRSDGLVNVLTE